MLRLLPTVLIGGLVAILMLPAAPSRAAPERPLVRLAQATAPADNAIKAAIADIARFEKQAATMRPGASGAKRTLKLLGLTEQRLNGSANKSHPSWVETNQRLQTLKQRLTDLAAGKRPGAAPAAASQPAPVKPAAPVGGAPSDPKLAQAMSEIRRIGAAVDQMAPGDKAKGRQHIGELNKVAASLKAYPDQKSPDWIKAAKAYNALNQKIAAKANAAAPAGTKPAQSGGGGAAPADPNVERAGRELDMIDRQVKNLRPGDRRGGMRFHKDLGRIAKVLNGAQDKAHPVWKDTVATFRRINDHIVTTLMQGINADLAKTAKRHDGLSELELLMKTKSDAARAELKYLWDAAAALGAPKHAEVQKFIAASRAADEKLVARINAAIEEHKKLGDVKARVDAIEARGKSLRVPQPLREPFTAEQIRGYAETLQKVEKASAEDVAYLKLIKGRTPLIASQRLSRLTYWIGEKPGKAKESAARTVQAVDAWSVNAIQQAEFLATTDVNDRDHVANRLLGAEQRDKTLKQLREGVTRIETAAVLDQAMGRQGGPDRAAQKAKLEQAIAAYDGMYKKALAESRMPKPAMTDEKYIEIAKKTLANPKYKSITPAERLVINSKVRRKEKTEGSASSGTITVYHYVWDQYQVATAEKAGDKYFIWYTTLKYFYKGGSTTPTEVWIISGRHQQNEILKENIDE
ncbi:MAG: hypothetical protein QF893_22770 [Alphaproteobacteria bacterium]|jgi:hypothetical protein|nr:hypothetical protein [Alphaproteobacteria bacterium]